MSMPILRLLVFIAAAGLIMAGCGVRGDLEPPPGAAAAEPADPALEEDPVAAGPDLDVFEEDSERVIQSQRKTRYPPASDSFVLDPLL